VLKRPDLVLKDVQCPRDDCAGMTQITIDSDEEITSVGVYGSTEVCPECGNGIKIKTRKR